jgi:hypothetical protein
VSDRNFNMNEHVTQKLLPEGKGPQEGRVRRLLPRAVHVETTDHKMKSFKLNDLLIKQRDGKLYNYTGETFSELGLKVGKPVEVVQTHKGQYKLIVGPSP